MRNEYDANIMLSEMPSIPSAAPRIPRRREPVWPQRAGWIALLVVVASIGVMLAS